MTKVRRNTAKKTKKHKKNSRERGVKPLQKQLEGTGWLPGAALERHMNIVCKLIIKID